MLKDQIHWHCPLLLAPLPLYIMMLFGSHDAPTTVRAKLIGVLYFVGVTVNSEDVHWI